LTWKCQGFLLLMEYLLLLDIFRFCFWVFNLII
jgi:hypothetical protein